MEIQTIYKFVAWQPKSSQPGFLGNKRFMFPVHFLNMAFACNNFVL